MSETDSAVERQVFELAREHLGLNEKGGQDEA
jgi:hypothetical protein